MSVLRSLPSKIFIPSNTFTGLLIKCKDEFNLSNEKYILERCPPIYIDKNIYYKKDTSNKHVCNMNVKITDYLTEKKINFTIETNFETKLGHEQFRIEEYIGYNSNQSADTDINTKYFDYSVIAKGLDLNEKYIWNTEQCNRLIGNKNIPFIFYGLYIGIKKHLKSELIY